MITLRHPSDRDHTRHGGLDSQHSFPFADCHAAHMGYGSQRLATGDAARLDGKVLPELRHGRGAELLVFDLAP